MNGQTVSSSVTSKVRTGIFEVFEPLGSAENEMTQPPRAVSRGKVSLAYTGGGKWVALCIDGTRSRTSTLLIEVRKDGTVVAMDQYRRHENQYGRVDLGKNGVPQNYFEVDLIKHYTSLKDLLAEEIAHRFSDSVPSSCAAVTFSS